MAVGRVPFQYQPLMVRGQARTTKVREQNPGSPEYRHTQESGDGSRQFYVQPSQGAQQITQIVNDFLGYTKIVPNTASPLNGAWALSRTIPMDNPDDPMLSAWDLHLKPDVTTGVDANQIGLPDEWIATCRYKDTPYAILSDTELLAVAPPGMGLCEASLLRYVSGDLQTAAYYQTVPPMGGGLKWNSDRQIAAIKRGVILAEGDLTVTWHCIPYRAIPWGAIRATIGKTNAPYPTPGGGGTLGGFGGPPSVIPYCQLGSLVMLEPQIRRYKQLWAFGDTGAVYLQMADIKYRFKHYPQNAVAGIVNMGGAGPAGGANTFYRWGTGPGGVGSGQFEGASFNPGAAGTAGTPLFQYADYTQLFIPATN